MDAIVASGSSTACRWASTWTSNIKSIHSTASRKPLHAVMTAIETPIVGGETTVATRRSCLPRALRAPAYEHCPHHRCGDGQDRQNRDGQDHQLEVRTDERHTT